MSIHFSSIHRALGVSGPLDFEMITRAVEGHTAEDDQLDWKQLLPHDGDEFAKDVAALANNRGGLLVYGVAEDRAAGHAAKIVPVSLRDAEQRRLRALMHSRISPVVPGLEFLPLASPENTMEGILVLRIPASPDSPHLVTKDQDRHGAPYRVGTQTFWMREWQIARAYQDRFARQASDEVELAALVDHVGDQVDLASGCWLVGVARPSVLASEIGAAPSRAAAVDMLKRALDLARSIAPRSDRRELLIRQLDDAALNPRHGFRRWVARTSNTQMPDSRSNFVHVELHHDGSVVLAARVDGWYRNSIEGKNCVPDYMVTGLTADLIGLVAASSEAYDLSGHTLARLDLLRADSAPFALLAPERIGGTIVGMGQPAWSNDVRRFIPVRAIVPGQTMGTEEYRQIAEALAGDVVSQFGYPPSSLW